MALAVYHFDPGFIWQSRAQLMSGLRMTVVISLIGILGSLVVGLLAGSLRANRVPVVAQLAGAYVELIRNTPLLVQIFFFFFALPELGVRLSGFTVACLSLVIWGGAYNTENFRGGLEAVPHGYREAARALGLSGWQAFLTVVLPIGFRIAYPSSINTCVSVLKNSAYMVGISFFELTNTAVSIISLSFKVFEMFLTIGAIYLLLVWGLSAFMQAIEARMAIPGTR